MKIHLVYQNSSHRGPGVVVKNLLKGLHKNNVKVVSDINKADLVGCLQHPGMVYNKLPKETLMGPNIFVLPDEAPEIWNSFKNYVVPCDWVKNKYIPFDIDNKRELNVWAVGIDTDEWAPDPNAKKEYDCFVYYKNRSKEDLLKTCRFLLDQNLNIKIIQYGQYQEDQLKDLCNKSRFAVILDDTESQGIAIQQIMSMNLPCFVLDKTFWEYKSVKCTATSVPYFSQMCGIKSEHDMRVTFFNFQQLLETFQPRKFIVENFNLEFKAREYLDILLKSFQ